MSPLPFLIAANLVLAARFLCFFRDGQLRAGRWTAKTLAETAALGACFEFGPALTAACLVILAANLVGAFADRNPAHRSQRRLLVGLFELAGLSLCFSPAAEPRFRDFWPALGDWCAAWTSFGTGLPELASLAAQAILLGLFLSANEANLAIRAVFDRLDLKPRQQKPPSALVDAAELNRGRVIGLLERALLYVFILQGQFGAIGFVLAAKAFARSKALDDRAFAEYVLIGTLLSGGLALSIGLAIRKFLNA